MPLLSKIKRPGQKLAALFKKLRTQLSHFLPPALHIRRVVRDARARWMSERKLTFYRKLSREAEEMARKLKT